MRAFAALLSLSLFGGAIVSIAACESSARVGELRDAAAPPETLVPEAGTDAGSGEGARTWRAHSPAIPCTIYAMAETRADDLYLGCNGGRLYRFDGVEARVTLEVDDGQIFSLLFVAANGEVWAGAQLGYAADAPTQLYHFDGITWSKQGDAKKRITSIAGSYNGAVWVTTDTGIFRYQAGALALEPSFTVASGKIRGCAFVTANEGYCVGTAGLVVAWDGQAWSPMTGAPWTTQAEVFGVEVDPFTKVPTFFYGEPLSASNGDHTCRIARAAAGTFTSFAASTPCFAGSRIARKRTGWVTASGRVYMLLATDETYGGALLFDTTDDAVRPLCGPILAFSTGLANTRAGGRYGLLATLVGAGGNQVALSSVDGRGGAVGSSTDFVDLSVAAEGAAWARVEDTIACGSVSKKLVRFDTGTWRPVAGPQGALSGRGLAAVAQDEAYTIDIANDALLVHRAGAWTQSPEIESAWSLSATKRDDVWVGAYRESFAHFDGKAFETLRPQGLLRQIEQITATQSDVWMVVQGVTAGDTNVRVVRYDRASKKLDDFDLGINRGKEVRISALDATHAFHSGVPAKAWDGTRWKDLDFEASGVWARAADEVYFTDGGDIWRWNGVRRERVYRGFIPITAIDGRTSRGFAVGPGGLTLELGVWPVATK